MTALLYIYIYALYSMITDALEALYIVEKKVCIHMHKAYGHILIFHHKA